MGEERRCACGLESVTVEKREIHKSHSSGEE